MQGREVLFWVVFIAVAIVAAVLYFQQSQWKSCRGIAEVVEYGVSTDMEQRVLAVSVHTGDRVIKGEVVATMDPRMLTLEMEVLSAELDQRQLEYSADRLSDERRFASSLDRVEIALLRARLDAERDRAELVGVRARARWWKPLVEAGSASAETLNDLEITRKELEQKLVAHDVRINGLKTRLGEARARLDVFEAAGRPGDQVPASSQSALAVCRARLNQVQARLESLSLKAPADGVVYRVLVHPGDVATPGNPILLIRSESPTRVMAYTTDSLAQVLDPGTPAFITPRDASGRRWRGRVISVGTGMVPFPPQIQNRVNWSQEWGREVIVGLEEDAYLVAGQMVDVDFDEGAGKPKVLDLPAPR